MHEKNVRPVQDLVVFFKKQSKVGRVLLGTFFIAMWVSGWGQALVGVLK